MVLAPSWLSAGRPRAPDPVTFYCNTMPYHDMYGMYGVDSVLRTYIIEDRKVLRMNSVLDDAWPAPSEAYLHYILPFIASRLITHVSKQHFSTGPHEWPQRL